MIVEPGITLGNVLEIGSILITGLVILVRQNSNITFMQNELIEVKKAIKKFEDLFTNHAVMDNRIKNMENDIRDIRHGRGFVREVQGEYMTDGKVKHGG